MELPAGEVSDMEAYDRFYRGLKPHLARELNKTPQPNWNAAIIFTERIEGATVLRERSAWGEHYAYADDDAYVAAEPNASADTYEDGDYGEDGEYYDDDECYDQDDNGEDDGYGEDDNGDADPDADEAPMELGTITGGVQDNGPPYFGLNEYQRQNFADENRCFCCHKAGHHYNKCWSLQASSNRNARGGAGRSH